MKKYNRGFVLGKFMPLHNGHIFLLETAQNQCKVLTILLCSQPDDPIPGDIRFEWLKKRFPGANMIHCPEPLPRDQSNELFWDIWRKTIEKYLAGQKINVVFSSEKYGQRLANELNAENVEVDLKRTNYTVSGSDIRNDPKAYEKFIPDIVKPYYKERLR